MRRAMISIVTIFVLLGLLTLGLGVAQAGSISGKVTYTGALDPQKISRIIVVAGTLLEFVGPGQCAGGAGMGLASPTKPGDYTILNLADATYVVFGAIFTETKPIAWGFYGTAEGPAPVTISGGATVTGIDITMGDIETVVTSSNLGSISGTVSYTRLFEELLEFEGLNLKYCLSWVLAFPEDWPERGTVGIAFLPQPGGYTVYVPEGTYIVQLFSLCAVNIKMLSLLGLVQCFQCTRNPTPVVVSRGAAVTGVDFLDRKTTVKSTAWGQVKRLYR